MKINLIKAERILSPTQISIAPYAINPYRGCPLGCIYCYAQENKAIKNKGLEWGEFIDVKINAVEILEREIKGKNIKRILLGSTVECYPPQERDFLITQKIIKLLNANKIPVTILTKSCLIQRDLELISKFSDNKIYLTINFNSEGLKKSFEPKSPSIKERIKVLKLMNNLKIQNRVHIAPFIPSIQDIEKICKMVGKYTQEISIELYNFKMGNWKSVKKVIQNKFGEKKTVEIEEIFDLEKNYLDHIDKLDRRVRNLREKLNKKILFLFPNFKDYYRSDVAYD